MALDLDDRGRALENEYFHKREQELIAKMKAKFQEAGTVNLDIKCPKCDDGTLVEADFEGVKIDTCENCGGVWLDAGELTRIADKGGEPGWFGRIFMKG